MSKKVKANARLATKKQQRDDMRFFGEPISEHKLPPKGKARKDSR